MEGSRVGILNILDISCIIKYIVRPSYPSRSTACYKPNKSTVMTRSSRYGDRWYDHTAIIGRSESCAATSIRIATANASRPKAARLTKPGVIAVATGIIRGVARNHVLGHLIGSRIPACFKNHKGRWSIEIRIIRVTGVIRVTRVIRVILVGGTSSIIRRSWSKGKE
jgi:hypothetical protein